jgi:hypothetical protein
MTLDEEWDEDEHAASLYTWAPRCPIGNPQRVAQLVGYREREPGRLQLRAVMHTSEGICEAIAEEDEQSVRVRVLLCYEDDDDSEDGEYLNCPVHVYLEAPLNGRTVVAVDMDRPLPLYAPKWEIEHNERVKREQAEADANQAANAVPSAQQDPATQSRRRERSSSDGTDVLQAQDREPESVGNRSALAASCP